MIAVPKISIVTPSFNQAEYLERTILSVLDQAYPNLEFIIIDGGSTDGSVEIVKRYSSRIAYWVSEPDNGQAHAINKGLRHATGEWLAWQNSDDIFYPGAFSHVAEAIQRNHRADFIIGDINLINADDTVIRDIRYVRPTYRSLLAEGSMVLTNQAAFWRRSLHDSIGWLDESLHYGFDYEWFLRILKETKQALHVPEILGALRLHADTKTSQHQAKFADEYRRLLSGREADLLEKRYFQVRRMILTLLNGKYRYVWRGVARRFWTLRR